MNTVFAFAFMYPLADRASRDHDDNDRYGDTDSEEEVATSKSPHHHYHTQPRRSVSVPHYDKYKMMKLPNDVLSSHGVLIQLHFANRDLEFTIEGSTVPLTVNKELCILRCSLLKHFIYLLLHTFPLHCILADWHI